MTTLTTQDQVLLDAIEHYGWKPTSVKKIDNIWKIQCEDGVYALKRAKASKEKLFLLHRILEKMRPNFPHLLPWIKTKEGSPVYTRMRTSWYATPWKEKKEMSKASSPTIIKTLATFHHVAESVVKSYPELFMDVPDDKLSNWQQNRDVIPQYRKKRGEREFQSPFDKCFARCDEMLERVVDFSVHGMERFFDLEKGSVPRYTLCYKRFHPRQIVQDEDQYYFTNFDHAQVESPVSDIATIIRRLSDPGDEEHPLELFEAYDSINKLYPMEKKLLALHLAYPEKILKNLNKYYMDASVLQNELTSVRRLEKQVNQLEQFEELIKTLWNTKKSADSVAKKEDASLSVASKRKGKKGRTAKT